MDYVRREIGNVVARVWIRLLVLAALTAVAVIVAVVWVI